MKRATACLLLLTMGSLAIAADESGVDDEATEVEVAEPSEEEALPPVEEPPEDLRPISGVRYKVTLKGGRHVRGVVRSTHIFERWSTAGGYEEADLEEADAGVRLWFPGKQDGFIFVKVKDIETLSEQGELTRAEGIKLARRQFMAAQTAKRARELERIRKRRRAAEAAAAADGGEKGSASAGEAEEKPAPVLTRKQEALLIQFPPGDWTPERPDEIQRRQTVLGLFPSKDEKAFLEVFDSWKAAYVLWLAAKEKQDEVASVD